MSFETRIDGLIQSVTQRNSQVQTKKKEGSPTSWIAALVLSLVSLIGIGLAMWFAHRRGKELAKMRTQIEQDKVLAEQKEHQAQFDQLMKDRLIAFREAQDLLKKVQERKIALVYKELEHQKQVERIQALKSWAEIHEGPQ